MYRSDHPGRSVELRGITLRLLLQLFRNIVRDTLDLAGRDSGRFGHRLLPARLFRTSGGRYAGRVDRGDRRHDRRIFRRRIGRRHPRPFLRRGHRRADPRPQRLGQGVPFGLRLFPRLHRRYGTETRSRHLDDLPRLVGHLPCRKKLDRNNILKYKPYEKISVILRIILNRC